MRQRRTLLASLLAACVLLPGCAAQGTKDAVGVLTPPPEVTRIPLVRDRGYALIALSIGGHRDLWFVVDSAASSSAISPATRDRLGLASAATQATVTGGSGTADYQAVELPSFALGGQTFDKLGAVVIDFSRFQAPGSTRTFAGILGNDVLRRFDFAIDLPRFALLLRPRGSGRASDLIGQAVCVPNEADDDGWVVMDLRVNGAPVRAIVDTGAGRSIFNGPAARAAGVAPEAAGVTRAVQNTQGLGSQAATPTRLHTFERVDAGPVRFSAVPSRIADLPVFAALGLAQQPAAIFGINYLNDRGMAVSYPHKEICFSPVQDDQ